MKLNPNPRITEHKPSSHGGINSIKYKKNGILDYSSNINPLGCHPGVKKYLKKHPEQLHSAASGLILDALKEAFPCL